MDRATLSPFVNTLLTDYYQLSMLYGYWKSDRHLEFASFDCFFRKSPFGGEFTIFAGISSFLDFVEFKLGFSEDDIGFLRTHTSLAGIPDEDVEPFFGYVRTISGKDLRIHAVPEGSIVFPRLPLVRIEGPLAVAQLVETTLLTLINFPSLIATKAAHFRIAAGPKVKLVEFGLRRAQGPDGGMTASRFAYLGGFEGTSNVLAGKLYGIPVSGTIAHAFVMTFADAAPGDSLERVANVTRIRSPLSALSPSALCPSSSGVRGPDALLLVEALRLRELLIDRGVLHADTNIGELHAFVAYATAFPSGLLALVDTYDTLASGAPNFAIVAAALKRVYGYDAVGIRLDSGDLAYLSIASKELFRRVGDALVQWDNDEMRAQAPLLSRGVGKPAPGSAVERGEPVLVAEIAEMLRNCKVVASNDLDVAVIHSLNDQGHSVDIFGVGTNLVTCASQPALGAVYKLASVKGVARMKFSEDKAKQSLPCSKAIYRFFGKDGNALLDYLDVDNDSVPPGDRADEARVDVVEPPAAGQRILCQHPADETKRCIVMPTRVERLDALVWDYGRRVPVDEGGALPGLPLEPLKARVEQQLLVVRPDHKRNLNPTPYKVSVSPALWGVMQSYWSKECPVREYS